MITFKGVPPRFFCKVTLARESHALKGSQSRLLTCSLVLSLRKKERKIWLALINLFLIKLRAVFRLGGTSIQNKLLAIFRIGGNELEEKRRVEIKKIDEQEIAENAMVTVTQMGHIVEVQHMDKVNRNAHIRKVDKEHYVDLSTGELHEFKLSEVRSQNINSLRQTFKKMRYLINNNFSGERNELFVTLTYRGDLQTRDYKRVKKDFISFYKRFQRKYGDVDYIRVLEPHASGNWHLHVLFRLNEVEKAYVSNEEMASLWRNGFVNVQATRSVDNVGAYLTAYLADVSTDELYDSNIFSVDHNEGIFEKEVEGETKRFVKGGRLSFYPTGVNIYASSKGIVAPERKEMSYSEAKKIARHRTPHYKKSISIADESRDYQNTITYEQYNLKRQ